MKKTFKRIVILMMLALLFAVATVGAFASSSPDGITFSSSSTADKWHMRTPLADAPYSFETWIKVPTTIADDKRIGYFFSNYDGGYETSTYYGNETYGNRTIIRRTL